MSHRNLALGTVIIFITLVTFALLAAETYTAMQTINPLAVLAAVVVAVVGLAWFKKSIR